jgi:hypothetical protein
MRTVAAIKNIKRTGDAEVEILQFGAPLHQTTRSITRVIDDREPSPSPRKGGVIDAGIRQAVKRLQESGIHTFESCEGGPGHSYPEPTVAFHGGPETGWKALAVCMAYRLPVQSLQRIWHFYDGEPHGPYWELVFST